MSWTSYNYLRQVKAMTLMVWSKTPGLTKVVATVLRTVLLRHLVTAMLLLT
jgi:hypothetical protein